MERDEQKKKSKISSRLIETKRLLEIAVPYPELQLPSLPEFLINPRHALPVRQRGKLHHRKTIERRERESSFVSEAFLVPPSRRTTTTTTSTTTQTTRPFSPLNSPLAKAAGSRPKYTTGSTRHTLYIRLYITYTWYFYIQAPSTTNKARSDQGTLTSTPASKHISLSHSHKRYYLETFLL